MANGIVINSISGIWNSDGCIPEAGESISIRLADSTNATYESLIDLVGFEEEKKDIGVIAESRIAKELVVMLPMVFFDENTIGNIIPTDYETVSVANSGSCEPCSSSCSDAEEITPKPGDIFSTAHDSLSTNKWYSYQKHLEKQNINVKDNNKNERFFFSKTEKAFLFKIDINKINTILGVPNYKDLTIYQIREILLNKENINGYNTIAKLMLRMTQYNFPPHLNWLYNKSLEPFVIYTAEFSHVFSQEDLKNIWQGNLPNAGVVPEENNASDESVIEHELNNEEFFGGYDLINEELDIKMKIFKIKQRAHYDFAKDIKGIDKFSYPNRDQEWYQYNWPYDYFSLVELLKVEGGEVYEPPKKE